MKESLKEHWDKVYETKNADEVSWTQDIPKTSLDFLHSFNLSKSANIIDIGGGDSKLVDHLLKEGFKNITVLDISEKAIDKAKKRLGPKALDVKWIVSDITAFKPDATYDVWHDRATFHFLTTKEEVHTYIDIARRAVKGFLTIGTFSDEGPKKCSGLPIKQYNEAELTTALDKSFTKLRCITEDHITPFQTKQHFLFCSFRRGAAL